MEKKQKVLSTKAKEYYVYLLYDIQTKELFYVGKGKGKRPLDHLKDAQKSGVENVEDKKIERIRQIGDKRLGCTILRRNLAEQEALQVEAATIDLLRSTTYRNIKGEIFNIQSGHGIEMNGMIDIKQFKAMRTKFVEILKSETLLCLNITSGECMNLNLPKIIHNKKWKVKQEEASKSSYTVVECDNVVVAMFKSDCWKDNGDNKTCTFNGNQINTPDVLLSRFISHKLPKRKRGTPQARYINYTDIKTAKKHNP